MGRTRAALAVAAAFGVAALASSGASGTDPRTPAGLPGVPPPFLGTAVVGSGGVTAAIDAYGDVVDLRAPGPAGRALIENPAARQAAGTVPAGTGIVPWVSLGDGPALPLWRADAVRQRYAPGSNVVRTIAWFGPARVVVLYAALGRRLACLTEPRGAIVLRRGALRGPTGLSCDNPAARRTVRRAARADRRWLSRSLPLAGAPAWAQRLYARSQLALRALTDRRTGAVAAGERDGWAYVWPRDAGAVCIALAASGHRRQARRIARFLLRLPLPAAARFGGSGEPIPGRGPQGDAAGWVGAAARAAGLRFSVRRPGRRELPDYQEGAPGNYLGNAIASGERAASILAAFGSRRALVREAGDPGSGLDSAAAWAVRPFARPRLFPPARRSLLRLAARAGRYGITPAEGWPGRDPWTAPTAWTAWSLAALGVRRQALRLLEELRRAATPTGLLPERVDARSGLPRSTTPLAWSEAFTILALRALWPIRQEQADYPRHR